MLYDHWMIGWTFAVTATRGQHLKPTFTIARSFQSGKLVLEQVGVGETPFFPTDLRSS